MNLKMRPMSEAPADEWLLTRRSNTSGDVVYDTANYRSTEVFRDRPELGDGVVFCRISDLLRAAETLDKITPEGFEYTGEVRQPREGDYIANDRRALCVKYPNTYSFAYPILRRIQPPVEYRYETDGQLRQPQADEYCWSEVDKRFYLPHPASNAAVPRLCYTRREVKSEAR